MAQLFLAFGLMQRRCSTQDVTDAFLNPTLSLGSCQLVFLPDIGYHHRPGYGRRVIGCGPYQQRGHSCLSLTGKLDLLGALTLLRNTN